MKKRLIIFGLIAVLGIGSTFVYADNIAKDNAMNPNKNTDFLKEGGEWHRTRIKQKRENIDEALKEGKISEEKARVWKEHFDYMDEFHRENGFIGDGIGGCHGRKSPGMGRGYKRGFTQNK